MLNIKDYDKVVNNVKHCIKCNNPEERQRVEQLIIDNGGRGKFSKIKEDLHPTYYVLCNISKKENTFFQNTKSLPRQYTYKIIEFEEFFEEDVISKINELNKIIKND